MRVADGNIEWCNFLLAVGEGRLPDDENHKIMLPDGVVQVNNLDEMVAAIYGSPIDPELFQDRAILAPKNVDVDRINTLIMDKFEGEERISTSIDSVEDDSQNKYPMELFLNSLRLNDTPPHRLMLQVGNIVMCIRNVNKPAGLTNGTRVRVTKLYPNMIGGIIVTEGSFRGKPIIIPRIKLSPSDSTLPFTFQRLQLPVRPAFVMTINKSQCQTLQKIGLFTENGSDIFSHGQAYVALSRASQGPSGIVVFNSRITNIVYREFSTLNHIT